MEDCAVRSLISMDNISVLMNVASVTPRGNFIEIGVYQGGSAFALNMLAEAQQREIHLFDTFEGMPEKSAIDTHNIGDFADTSLEAVRRAIPRALFHVGMFPETMPDWLGNIAFAHVDCDQYASVKAACLLLPKRMVAGGIIYFDDYGCMEGATAAVDEVLPKRIVLQNGKAMYVVH